MAIDNVPLKFWLLVSKRYVPLPDVKVPAFEIPPLTEIDAFAALSHTPDELIVIEPVKVFVPPPLAIVSVPEVPPPTTVDPVTVKLGVEMLSDVLLAIVKLPPTVEFVMTLVADVAAVLTLKNVVLVLPPSVCEPEPLNVTVPPLFTKLALLV